jgi:glutamate synthase (NADPH/NADH) small chain
LCEKACVLGIKGVPVAIGCLERFAADYERNSGMVDIPPKAAPTGRKIAIVGAGPAGLTAASDLARLGHEVVIFEALHEPGGVLFYGIPQFRLPKDVVRAEIRYLERLGISIRTNSVIGKIATVDELLEQGGYDALFIATGAGLPYFLGIGGENLNGVYTANEFLTRINLMGAWRFPEYDTPLHAHKRFAVIGGGNTALDAARTARRLPTTEEVTLVYRRSRAEMPARKEEVAHAEAEGIHFLWLTAPVKFLGEKGWVNAVECLHMELGESDESGRRHPVPEPNSNFLLEEDAVIIAVGNGVNPLIARTTPAIRTTRRGTIEVLDPSTGQTAREGVFAGGDIVTGAATVIEAMGSGKRAAVGIHQYLTYQNPKPPTESTDPSTSK